jgi:RHS repeat-associated protein
VGRLTALVSPNGNVSGGNSTRFTTTYAYDALDRMTATTDPLGRTSSFSYDANGNLTSSTDPRGQTTTYTYDLAGQLTTMVYPGGSTESVEYNGDGTIWKQIDGAGGTTTYGYDPLGRTSSVTDPLGRVANYEYTPAGNLFRVMDFSSQSTRHFYDDANQLTNVMYDSDLSRNVTFAYDALGRTVTMTDDTGSSTWAYDSLGRLTRHRNGAGKTVRYAYDLNNRITGMTYPSGLQVTRGFDAAGRLTQVSFPVGGETRTATFEYDANSNLTQQTVPSTTPVTDVYTYSRSNALLSVTTTRQSATPVTLAQFTYTRDAGDLLRTATQTLNGTVIPKQTYTYDGLNQLSKVNAGTYGYDVARNLTAMPGATLTYNAAHQLTSMSDASGVTTFAYDNTGNRTQKSPSAGTAVTYTYDQANRLIGYGANATYTYNGAGLRMSKHVSGVTTRFVWDVAQGLPLLLQENATNYVYGPGGSILARVASTNVFYYHRDQLGSVRLLTDGASTVKATYTYDAWGRVTSKTGAVKNPFGFAGEYTDAESGMLYLRARYYDPASAQFISRDPLVRVTREPYSYASNTPLNLTDPSGTCPWCVTAGIGAAVGGVMGGLGAAAQGGDLGDIMRGAAGGAAGGAMAGLLGPAGLAVRPVFAGLADGLTSSVTTQALEGCFDLSRTIGDTVSGGVAGKAMDLLPDIKLKLPEKLFFPPSQPLDVHLPPLQPYQPNSPTAPVDSITYIIG